MYAKLVLSAAIRNDIAVPKQAGRHGLVAGVYTYMIATAWLWEQWVSAFRDGKRWKGGGGIFAVVLTKVDFIDQCTKCAC